MHIMPIVKCYKFITMIFDNPMFGAIHRHPSSTARPLLPSQLFFAKGVGWKSDPWDPLMWLVTGTSRGSGGRKGGGFACSEVTLWVGKNHKPAI